MRSIRNIRIGPIGEAIIGTLVAGTIVTTFAMFPGLVYVIAPFIKRKRYNKPQAIARNLESLIQSGVIKQTIRKDGTIALTLTARGKWEAAIRHSKISSLSLKKRVWDKVWRLVIFDIENKKSKQRGDLRRAMQMYGFKPIQKSVWVYPFECDDFVALLKSHLDVAQDVLYMKVSYIENDRHLRKEFSL